MEKKISCWDILKECLWHKIQLVLHPIDMNSLKLSFVHFSMSQKSLTLTPLLVCGKNHGSYPEKNFTYSKIHIS